MSTTVEVLLDAIEQTNHGSNVCVSPFSLSKIIMMNNKIGPDKIKIDARVGRIDCIEDFEFAVGNKELLSDYFENVYDQSDDISRIIKARTHDKIIVSNDLFNDRPALVNCIYFKSNWTNGPFESDKITFNNRQIPAFRANRLVKYYSCAEFAAIDLPYDNGVEMMFINIPKLDKRYLKLAFHSENVNFKIPCFEINGHITDFSNLLCKYGMSCDKECMQLIYLKVDELGTEATAATILLLKSLRTTFEINSPFAFILHKGNEIIFMGIISHV